LRSGLKKTSSTGECIVPDLKTLYVEELKDLLDAENQLVKAIPKMAAASTSGDLRSGFEHHLEQTRNHAKRIEEILQALGEAPKGKKCKGMQGIIAEGKQILGDHYEGAVKDSGIISAAQRVEHYEIAAYGCLREYAQFLGQSEAVSLLGKTLEEEKETDEKLTNLAHTINQQAIADAEQKSRGVGA
jgi:ferritin-like metal-binding protein YciE